MLTPYETLGVAISQLIFGILLVITFLLIRYKQKSGVWKGVDKKGAVFFLLLFIVMMIAFAITDWWFIWRK